MGRDKSDRYRKSLHQQAFDILQSMQAFDSMDHFKTELVEYLEYYNNRRIKARLKGLPPALHRQQALLAA